MNMVCTAIEQNPPSANVLVPYRQKYTTLEEYCEKEEKKAIFESQTLEQMKASITGKNSRGRRKIRRSPGARDDPHRNSEVHGPPGDYSK